MKSNIVKVLHLVALTLLVSIGFTSCEKIKGKGDVVTETRWETNFTSISLAMQGTVYFTQDSNYSIQINAQQNVIDRIITEMDGATLKIKLKNNVHLGSHEPIRFYITAPSLNHLTISGSGDVYVENTWTGSSLSAHISGSGNINVANMDAGRFQPSISGSGSITVLGGIATQADLTISGSGKIEMHHAVSTNVYTSTSGSGDSYVQATDLLDVTISGSGNVYYLGNPLINSHISGSGNIRHL
jgi:hypothetical protein